MGVERGNCYLICHNSSKSDDGFERLWFSFQCLAGTVLDKEEESFS